MRSWKEEANCCICAVTGETVEGSHLLLFFGSLLSSLHVEAMEEEDHSRRSK